MSAIITASVQPGVGGLTGVENLTVTNANAAAADDLTVTFSTATQTFISGVTAITNLASTDGLTFARVTELATINLNNTGAATTVQFADAVLSGTADTVTLNVNGATGAVTIGTVTDADGDFETLNIVATGGSSAFDATNIDGDVATLNISGSGNLALGAASFANIETVAAGNATGNVSLILAADGVTGATNTKTVTMGSGDDTVNIAALDATTVGAVVVNTGAGDDTVVIGTIANDYTINGGAGTDTLSFNALPTVATAVGVTGFEVLTSTVAIADAATTTLDLAVFGAENAINRVNVAGALATEDDSANDIFAITNARDVATLGINIADADGDDAVVSFARLIDGTANALTIAVTAAGGGEISAINANDEETITINTADGALALETMSATDMTSLVLVGDNAANVGTVTAASLTSVDASGLEAAFTGVFTSATGALTFTAGTGVATVTGGAGNDTINGGAAADVLVGGAGNDTINGGAGADTITGGAGTNTLTGGAGVDVFVVGFGTDTITDFVVGATGDDIRIDISAVEAISGMDLVFLDDFVSVGAGAAARTTITGATDLADATADSMILVVNGNIATAAALEDALELGGAFELTINGTVEAGDGFLVLYDDGVNSYLATVESRAGIADNDPAAVGDLIATNFVTFTGIADATTILDANFVALVA
ncbi:beta strand repeat-containing protein [Yoonia vestfoldensis]|uniref:beta strand repeat-containing protein n=1 Tax=Yoonia vestfoldensis TaxID=245188 RepID=UPI000B395BF7|nr:calcium-binding protein [Yoonia vestfoldensis]